MAWEEVRLLEGRDLDAEVARAVFGLEPVYVAEQPWECHIDRENPLNSYCNFGGAVFTDEREWVVNEWVLPCRDGGLHGGKVLPAYSADMGAVGAVVKRMGELGWTLELLVPPGGPAIARFRQGAIIRQAEGRTASEAICRAALLARQGGERPG